MRRATLAAALLLSALLAAPSAVRAQAMPGAGQVTFDNAFIGAEACSSTATTQHTVRMAWADQVDTTAQNSGATSGVFRIFASNTAPVANTGGAQYCPAANPNATSGPISTAQVGGDIANTGTSLTGVASGVSTSALANAAGYGACNQDGKIVYVCVEFHPYVLGSPQGTPTGWSVGQMTFSLTVPSSATLDGVLPGDGALNVDWSGSAPKYKVVALSMMDPTLTVSSGAFVAGSGYVGFNALDPTRHETGFITGTGPFRMSGLVNYVSYAVAVVAYSAADTPADPSNVLTSEPQPVNDFWRLYKAAGGRESGGCSSGLAGPLGLGLLIATLALVRRRK